MSLFEELQNLMLKYHFRPEKKLSQFYCINEALLVYLINSSKMASGDVVLEIGPGTGFLTQKLVERAKKVGAKVIAVEPDELMLNILREKFVEEISSGVLTLIEGSILDQDFEALKVNKIVSLPPYHISSDLLAKIGLAKGLSKVILVLDKGFVEKLLAFEGLTEYVALTVLINLNSKLEIIENTIEQQSFFPVPSCLSTVVQLDFNVKNNSKEFYFFIRELFRHKNKDLQKSLRQSFNFLGPKFNWKEKDFEEKIAHLDLAQKKVYLLSPEEFLSVFNYFNSAPAKKDKKAKAGKDSKESKEVKEKKVKSKK
ncbi:MAG: rRNA adenine N-6-methyltransferase family protein [archaeon]|jgi:16S rRNA (adenine1518-N6/adenine1519-N6)-dimethyltransferase